MKCGLASFPGQTHGLGMRLCKDVLPKIRFQLVSSLESSGDRARGPLYRYMQFDNLNVAVLGRN